MKLTQRTLILGAVVAVLVVVLALQVVDAVFVVIFLALLALAGLVVWSRLRSLARTDEEADWAEAGDEWGLATEEAGDEYVDLDDRLSGFGAASSIPRRDRRPVVDDEPSDDAWEVEEEVWEEAPGAASYSDTVDEEFEEIIEAFDEPVGESAVFDEVEEYVEYEEYEEEPEPVRQQASIFAAPGVIDEEAVDSDDAILAASEATRLQYDDVLSREDANAETREILSRVASLLAKYE